MLLYKKYDIKTLTGESPKYRRVGEYCEKSMIFHFLFVGVFMYKFMSQEEIEIQQMSQLKMIHLYQLGGSDALAVYYGDNKQINLCAMDTYYNVLMKKVLSLYSLCENKESIIMDASTKEIFDNAMSGQDYHTGFFNRVGKKYMYMEGSLSPTFATDGVLRETLMPLLKYYLNQLYHMWDIHVEFEREPLGWRRNCVLKVRKGEEIIILPVKMDFMRGNECRIIIGNFLQALAEITFEISYREDQLYIWFESQQFSMVGESHFELLPRVQAHTTIRVNDRVVYHQNEDFPSLLSTEECLQQISDLPALLEDAEIHISEAKIYQLPWKGLVLLSVIESVHDMLHRSDYDILYIEQYRKKRILRQFSHSLIENREDGLKLRTDGAALRKLYYGNNLENEETHFMPVGYYSGWDYKEFLEDKYFYRNREELK